MLRNEGDPLKRVIVCTPRREYFDVADLTVHNMNEIAEPDLTHHQFGALKQLLVSQGAEVIDVTELTGHPNSVFTRDVALVAPGGFVKVRMGLESRRGEEAWMAEQLEGLGERCIGEIEPPGTVEGGDVILSGDVAFVGRSCRSNATGVEQLSAILLEEGYEVRVADISDEWMHIGGPMSAIGPRRVVCCEDVLPAGFFDGFDVVEVPNRGPSTGNVLCIGPDEVVANAAENVDTIHILEANGVTVHGIDLSEFRKGAGGPTCLTLPLERSVLKTEGV
jgi:dimethylargininase